MTDSSATPYPVMPAHAGIHDLLSLQQRESWIPACAGMTGGQHTLRLSAAGMSSFRGLTTNTYKIRFKSTQFSN